MFTITSASPATAKVQLLREWFIAEWDRLDAFGGSIDGLDMPDPILALEGDNLVGGLAFTRAAMTGSDVTGLWINAVLVAPPFRGRGIATRLIGQAETDARAAGFTTIHVLTDIPLLYSKLGWTVARESAKGFVLNKHLERSPV